MRILLAKVMVLVFVGTTFHSCKVTSGDYQQEAENADYLHRSMKKLSDVIVHDIFSPPVASRIYAYPSIAAYEVMQHSDDSFISLAGQLNGLENVPQPEVGEEYCYQLAATQAFLKVGKALIFSEDTIATFHESVMEEFYDMPMSKGVYNRSIAYGDQVANHILEWSGKDNYKETRTFPKYSIQEDPNTWQPTPPAYMDGIEPHWREIRPMVIDSAQQFTPPPPTPIDLEKNSRFYKELMEVYSSVKAENKEERIEIAKFWDCNPYVQNTVGHVMFATKKITPGGHWIGITDLACKKANADFLHSAEAYAMVSISLMDAFISCWDEKYRSNLVRPETVINEHLDPAWKPVLQTPPFPEYTSGHSVISTASALTLTKLFGENFSFEDSVELEYGLPVRSFNSFLEASSEAAISRLYGGIHYRPAIDYGVEQGRGVGEFILQNVKTRG